MFICVCTRQSVSYLFIPRALSGERRKIDSQGSRKSKNFDESKCEVPGHSEKFDEQTDVILFLG